MSPLVEILDREADLYAELRDLLAEEEAALVKGSGQVTATSLARKEGLLVEIQMVEVSRQAVVRRLTGRTDARLRDLPGADVGELARARARLTALLPEVAESSRRVDVLLERALTRLHNTLDLIREAVGMGPQYTPGARLVQAPMPTLDGRV
jgi:flagellar biosynthesis/type III secretory pathway chaperone